MHQSEVHLCSSLSLPPPLFPPLSPLSFTAFLVCRHGFLGPTDADDEVLSVFPDVCSWLRGTVETISLPHTHICPPNTSCTVNSQPTLSHYTWKLTIIPYMAFPASQYLFPFYLLLPGEAISSFHILHLRCP